jgi:hypothetical protein
LLLADSGLRIEPAISPTDSVFIPQSAFHNGSRRILKNPVLRRLLKKVQLQGEARGVPGPYVAAPRERANAPPAAVPSAAEKDAGPFSAAC